MRAMTKPLLCLATVWVLTVPHALAETATLGLHLQQRLAAATEEPLDILVFLKTKASLDALAPRPSSAYAVRDALVATAVKTQTSLRRYLQSQGAAFETFYIANLIAVKRAPPSLIRALAKRSDVGRILLDPVVQVLAPRQDEALADGPRGVEANIRRAGADRVWSNFNNRGEGLVIAGQDTGVDWRHPALNSQYRGRGLNGQGSHDYNWHDAIREPIRVTNRNPCGYNAAEPCDDYGHGTHTMGTAVGDDGVGNQIGMAPKSQWVACRNMDQGAGKPSTYLECFQFFLAPWPRGGDPFDDGDPGRAPDIMNNSWGCPSAEGCEGDEFLDALAALNAAGIMVVASAGNSGPGCRTIDAAPAHHSEATLSVGAINGATDAIAGFSSRGPSPFDGQSGPDLVAPGVQIRSSIPGGEFASVGWSGTSMAGPHVAGAVALLWSTVPSLHRQITPTVNLLRRTADPKTTEETCGGVPGSTVPNNTYGHGILNIYSAVDAAVGLEGKKLR